MVKIYYQLLKQKVLHDIKSSEYYNKVTEKKIQELILFKNKQINLKATYFDYVLIKNVKVLYKLSNESLINKNLFVYY